MTDHSLRTMAYRRMIRVRALVIGMIVAGTLAATNSRLVVADEPTQPRVRDGWKWMVTIPEINREETATLLTNGNAVVKKYKFRRVIPEVRILLWVEKGWLNVRRTTWDDELEWQVVLARASDPERPVIKIDEKQSSLELTYRGYFIRENGLGKIRIYREPKSADSPEWPLIKFEPWEFQQSRAMGRFLESFESDYWTWLQAGPTAERRDLWLKFCRAGGINADGTMGVSVANYGGILDEASKDRARAHVESDLIVATRLTPGTAEHGIAGAPLQKRLPVETAPALAEGKWLNSDKPVVLDNLKGKYVIVGFWAGWSESSVKKLKQMQVLHTDFERRGLKVIGVHSAHKADNVEEILRTNGVTFPVMIDIAPEKPMGFVPGETASRYRVDSLPAFFLIDTEGDVSSGYGIAPLPKEMIAELLN